MNMGDWGGLKDEDFCQKMGVRATGGADGGAARALNEFL